MDISRDLAAQTGDIAGRYLDRFLIDAGYDRPGSIPEGMTFREWCEDLGAKGLKVDGFRFTLADRPAMHFVYDQIPSTPAEAYGKLVVMMKCAQVGFTVMEMLATIYMALKFMPVKTGMYLPDMKMAGIKSDKRFMPIMRTIPDAYEAMTSAAEKGRRGAGDEGNVLTRTMRDSIFYFLWTSGKAMTESLPMDVLTFDEVQEMEIEQMEKASERLSASRIRFRLMGSTANYPDRDIHHWFKKGSQHRFWTECQACGESAVLDEHFPGTPEKPGCVRYDEVIRAWRYACVHCGEWLESTQRGEWRASNPGADSISLHFPQFLSPTISAGEIMDAYRNADSLKNFFNRKLGKPYTDPSQTPITYGHLEACVAAGERYGVAWKSAARQTFMGIDNMGGFSCAWIMERLPSGHMALVHAEQIHALDPWARLDVLMQSFGVAVAVCEQLPNYDSAKAFANRHSGRVFLVSAYKDIEDNMIEWGDATVSKADRKTSSEFRDRYTVNLDQYKMMSWAFARITTGFRVVPDPKGRVQEVVEKGVARTVALLHDVIWQHFTKTALVTEADDEQHKMKRKVMKLGLDPHFSFAFMMACAAWCRSYGTGGFIMPDLPEARVAERAEAIEKAMPGLPTAIVDAMTAPLPSGVCGRCYAFSGDSCTERMLGVGERDPACPLFVARER